MKKQYVKCISDGFSCITRGKIYEVVGFRQDIRGGLYTIIADTRDELIYYADNFEVVQCPCAIKTCIKHRG